MNGIMSNILLIYIIRRIFLIGMITYIIMTILTIQSCSNQSSNSSEKSINNNEYQEILLTESEECKSECRGNYMNDKYLYLSIGGKYTYTFEELMLLMLEYKMYADTVLHITVDLDSTYIGTYYFSNPVNGNIFQFDCYPIDRNEYYIVDAKIISPEFEFSNGIHISMTKQEFKAILQKFPLINCSLGNDIDYNSFNMACDTLSFWGDMGPYCDYIFNDNKLEKIIYLDPYRY
jgi:hypothetical protein